MGLPRRTAYVQHDIFDSVAGAARIWREKMDTMACLKSAFSLY
jgi:hypothetical protein